MNHNSICLCLTLEAGALQGQAFQNAFKLESHKTCPAVLSFSWKPVTRFLLHIYILPRAKKINEEKLGILCLLLWKEVILGASTTSGKVSSLSFLHFQIGLQHMMHGTQRQAQLLRKKNTERMNFCARLENITDASELRIIQYVWLRTDVRELAPFTVVATAMLFKSLGSITVTP